MKLMPHEQKTNLEKIFLEICQGFSKAEFNDSIIYVKHSNIEDINKLNEIKEKYLNKAERMGVMLEKDLLDFLEENGSWTKEEENFYEKSNIEISNLKISADKFIIKAQKDSVLKKIKELETEQEENVNKRKSLVKNTAEQYAERKSNEEFIFHCIFKDKDLKENFLTKEEFNELSIEQLSSIYISYTNSIKNLSNENIQQIAVESFFSSIFSLFGDDVSKFFNTNHLNLSYYQINLLNYAKMFRNVFKNEEVPSSIRNNASEILKYIEDKNKKSKTIESSKQKANNSIGYSHMKASKEDLEKAGIDTSGSKDIHEIAKEKGGTLNLQDFLKIHKK